MAKAKSASPMDAIKKHYFWIVVSVVVIVAFAVTIMARGNIKKQYTEKKTAVEGEKQTVDGIASDQKHPNQNTIDAIDAETDILKKSVFEAWTLMYDDQKSKNRWPRQLPPDLLDLVENQLKFRDPIGIGNPRLLEDYAFFIDKNLPELLKKFGRRRCQVKDYKLLKQEDFERLGFSDAATREIQFWPVYVDEANKRYYIRLTRDGSEDGPLEDIILFDIKDDILSKTADSAERDFLDNLERVPYFREVDPWLVYPKEYMTFGLDTSSLSFGMGGMMGGMSGDATGGGMMMPPGGMSMGGKGGGMGGMGGGMGGGARGGARGLSGASSDGTGGISGGMGGMSGGMGLGVIPGDGIDPALQQITGNTGNMDSGRGGAMGGAGGMGGLSGGRMGMASADPTTGGAGAMRSGGLGGPSGGMGGALGGASGGMTADNYPGLPPYKDRRRVVGNVDWPEPEVYALPTWEADANPLSIEIWYAQETLWVYEALIRVVAETNKEAGDNIALAPIKCVEAMLIGANAVAEWSFLAQAIGDVTGEMSSAAGGLMSMSGAMGGASAGGASAGGASSSASSSGGMGGMGGGMGTAASGNEEDMKLDMILYGRYIDLEDQPLLPSDKPPFAEFNRMPICLKLVVDQRRIPDVLVNCANSSMPIDITHVRICPDTSVPFTMPVPSAMAGGMGMMGGMGMGDATGGGISGGMGAMGGGASAGGRGGGSGARGSMNDQTSGGMGGMGGEGSIDIGRSELSQVEGYGVDAIRIEIYGIINIFNEPNLSKFGTGKDAEDKEASDTTMTEDTLNAPTVAEHQEAIEEAAEETDSEDDSTEDSTAAEPGSASTEGAGTAAEPGNASTEGAGTAAEPGVVNP